MTRDKVLVTDGQLRSGLAVVRSLGRRDVEVVCGESTRFATAFFSSHTDETVVYPSPDEEPAAFVDELERILQEHDVDVLVPVAHESTALVSKHRERLAAHATVPVPPFEQFKRGWDKRETFEAAAQADVPRPRTECPDGLAAATDVAAEMGYPVVVKARTGAGSRGLEFVSSPEEFEAAYERVHEAYPRPLVQERIPQAGRMYGAAFIVDDDRECKVEFACEFLREYPPSGGPSTFHRSVDRRDVRAYGRDLLAELDWTGVALVEFKEDVRDGEPKLMEVNPRLWSSLHLPVFAGLDFPWLYYRYATGEEVPRSLEYDDDVYGRYLLPGDLLRLASVRDTDALRSFFPLFDDRVNFEIPHRGDPGPALGRLAAMARFAASPRMWQKAIRRK